jgi:CRISPR-associated endonuclease Csn1
MKFKNVIGLDIGTNSLGWCLIKEYEDGTVEIVKTGVHIFPIGTIVDDKSNKEKTKNEQRRIYRGASRRRYRFKLRREHLEKVLSDLGMMPNYSKLHKAKGKGQSYELYKLRAEAINPDIQLPLEEIGRIFLLLNKYRGFKSNSKKLGPKSQEDGQVKRGCEELQALIERSGSQTIGEYFYKMHQIGNELYEQNKWHNPNEPVDERAYNEETGEFVLFNSNGIRRHFGRYTLRDMYLHEFDLIWQAQKKYYPHIFTGSKSEYDLIMGLPYRERIEAIKSFRQTNYWNIREYCIFYQRPLKSKKRFISNCSFERGQTKVNATPDNQVGGNKRIWLKKAKKGCPISHPLFQEFRILQKLYQIRYSSTEEDIFQAPLKKEWIDVLSKAMSTQNEIYLNKTKKLQNENEIWFGKVLMENGLIKNDELFTFYIDKTDEDLDHEEKNANRITGNVTYASMKEALGEDTFNSILNELIQRQEEISPGNTQEVQEPKTFLLWHHLYIAKDGLLKEEDWLQCILTDKSKWGFTAEQAKRLIQIGLQPEYGSYSIKVLKAILPFMRNGSNEYEALAAVNRGYINEDGTIGKKVELKQKISQIKYQELRNPVVERAVSKAIKVVNEILKKYESEIDRDSLTIRIESTRQLRKPRKERENERRQNADKDRLKEQYASYLNKRKVDLNFNRDIYKYDPLVSKYELWLQMNMNEEDALFEKEFKAFSKITRSDDKLKHKLWLECGRVCPYSGKVINLTDCFSSEVEIEHIIPLSRSLDDSFNNKTLTYRKINTDKGKMTPFEYLSKMGGDHLKEFKARIHRKGMNAFSDEKKKKFLAEKLDPGFLNQQLSNTSYIARFTISKMQEVCRSVYFTNGSITSELRRKDWNLSNLLEKIRFNEKTGIDIDQTFAQLKRLKQDFTKWAQKKHMSTDFKVNWDEISQNIDAIEYFEETGNDIIFWHSQAVEFDQFKNQSNKKDRSDHRHHAIDAFITACVTPRIVQTLSTYNALKEETNLPFRDYIDRSFNYFALKSSIENILVSHSEKQTLIKKRKNKIQTSHGVTEQTTYAPQGKLHEDSFYGKRNGHTVRRIKLFDDQSQEKLAFKSIDDLYYIVKGEKKWTYIHEKQIHEIAELRLNKLGDKAFTQDELEKNPFYCTSPFSPDESLSKKGKPLPIIKSVRKRFNIDRTLINLPIKKGKEVLSTNRYTNNESNFIIAFYKNGKKRFARPVSFFQAVKNKTNGKSLIPDEVEYKDVIYGIDQDLPWLKPGDLVIICDPNSETKINDRIWIRDRLFKIARVGTLITPNEKYGEYEYGRISLVKAHIANTNNYPNQKDIEAGRLQNSFTISHDKFQAIKVRIDILGDPVAFGADCF